MTDCRWILSKRISRSPKFQVVSRRDLEHDSFSGVLLWFAPAGWWGIGQRQVCLPKDWLSSSSAPWKQKTKELAGTPFGHKVWRQRGSKGWGEEKKNTDTAFVSPLNYGFLPLSQWERCRKQLMLRCFFRSDQWLEVGQRPACWWMRGSGRTKDDLA